MPLIGTFTRRLAKLPLLDLNKITAGLSKTWAGFLRDEAVIRLYATRVRVAPKAVP